MGPTPDSQARHSALSRPPVNWPWMVAFMFMGNVILWADRSNFSIAVNQWRSLYHWGPTVTGMLLSAFSFGYWLMQPIGGWLTDRIGPKQMLGYSMLGRSLCTLLTPIAPTVLWLTGGIRAMLGAVEAPFIPATAAAVARAVPSRTMRGKYYAFTQSGATLGPAAGTFFGALLAQQFGVTAIFVVFGGTGVLLAGLWVLYASRRGEPAPRFSVDREEERQREQEPLVPIPKMLSSKWVWAFIVPYFALPYCQFMFLTWLPTYFVQYRHLHLVDAGMVSALPFIAAFFAANLVGYLSDGLSRAGRLPGDLHRKLFVYVGALLFVVPVSIAARTGAVATAVVMIIIANAGLQFFVQPFWFMATDISPRQAGTLSSFMNFFGIMGATAAPALTGLLVATTHSFLAPFQLAAAIMAASAIAAGLFIRVRPLSELVGMARG